MISGKILFATTNDNKIRRIKRLISDLNIELLTLTDLQDKIEEPTETGENALEIAKNKAKYYWEKVNQSMPVLAQDDTLDFLGNVEPQDDPSISIKGPVIKIYGEFSIKNAIDYYSKLAEKYGGEIDFAFIYGHALANENGVKGVGSSLFAKLVKDAKGVENVGNYPLKALTKLRIGDAFIYSDDATSEQKVFADSDIKRALLELLE